MFARISAHVARMPCAVRTMRAHARLPCAHKARVPAQIGLPKSIQVPKWIQVASTSLSHLCIYN